MKQTLWAVVTGCVFGLTGDAFATDTKIYPGSMCRQLGNVNSLSYDGNGRAFNVSAAAVSVLCPIVRDHSEKGWISMEVTVADRNLDQNVVCRGVSAQVDGLAVYNTPDVKSAGAASEWYASQTLPIGAASASGQFRQLGTFYVRCTVPARTSLGDSGILRYQIVEP
jgi:hypothetical protein